MPKHSWQFAKRFRRNAFGWRSATPIQRIKEALKEIKQVRKTDPELAAEGGVRLLEKLSPALMHVDSSSGALGNAVNKAIDTLVPIIVKPDVAAKQRTAWLKRLWQALEDDDMPYLEHLGEQWGTLCKTPELASAWAEQLMPTVERTWAGETNDHFFMGTMPCLSALYAAERYQDLLDLLAHSPYPFWPYHRWGVHALAAQGNKAEAIHYAENTRGLNTPEHAVAQVCEDILLSSGLADEAYERYAMQANQRGTHVATFRAIYSKYPDKPAETILKDLIASTPDQQGKWFAAAKTVGLYTLAIELVEISPANPATLTRAARDFAETQPGFAIASGLAAIRWIAYGYGYDITAADVQQAYTEISRAAEQVHVSLDDINNTIRTLAGAPHSRFVQQALQQQMDRNTAFGPQA